MNKYFWLLLLFIALPCTLFAAGNEKEQERVKDAGTVLKEIIDIPDNIPKDLFDRAECVIVLPSVKKGAFGIGGSYGRGVMECRSGEHYTGPWGTPALYALEGVTDVVMRAPRFFPTRALGACLLESLWKARPCDRMGVQTRNSMDASSAQRRSFVRAR